MLLTEFDLDRDAVINPDMVHKPVPDFPETVVSIFSHHLFQKVVDGLGGKQIAVTQDVDGIWPVYEVTYRNCRLAMCKARLGAPACVGTFEELIPMGMKRLILLGNCGVLNRDIQDCGIIIPTWAIRDEGTSYHYAPSSDFIAVNRKHRALFREILEEHGYPYVMGTTWTTDAFYRETREKIARRREMGAICVEMECAAMQAMCEFRGVEFFQFLYAGDNLDHSKWDPRSISGLARLDEKEKIALLALELGRRIEERKESMFRFYDTHDLKDGEIFLRLTRTCAAQPEKSWLPAYYFDICLMSGEKIGYCDLRIGYNRKTYIGGNIGYGIDEAFRGNHYAAKACKLLFCQAEKHGMEYLTISCVPTNGASARTCELAGGRLLEIADIPEDNEMYAEGKRKVKIYCFDLI